MSDDERTLFVGNLSDRVTDELLYELFLQAGPLEKVVIPTDRDGRTRSFAFITFQHDVSVPYAKEVMEGVKLYGRSLKLQKRGGSSSDSPRGSPHASPHDGGHGSRGAPHYNRSNTWHGQDSGGPGQSPQRIVIQSQSPQYDIPNPYAAGKNFLSVDVLRGHSQSQGHFNDGGMLPREQVSIDIRRQRVLEQQNSSLNIHRQRQNYRDSGRHNGRDSYRDERNRNYRPYNDRDRRRR